MKKHVCDYDPLGRQPYIVGVPMSQKPSVPASPPPQKTSPEPKKS